MPKKMKKQRMIRMRTTKEKKDKDKNKIKQSVKINITTSGGGGSGGSGIPSIPQPIYNSMQGQRTGENVETNNLLKQLLKTQQPVMQATPIIQQPTIPLMQRATPIFEDESIPKVEERDLTDYNNNSLLQNINNANDGLEFINSNDQNDEALFINNNDNLEQQKQNNQIDFALQKQQNALNRANENLTIPIPESTEPKTFTQARKISNLPLGVFVSSNGKKFVAKYRKDHIGTFDTPEDAENAYKEYKRNIGES